MIAVELTSEHKRALRDLATMGRTKAKLDVVMDLARCGLIAAAVTCKQGITEGYVTADGKAAAVTP